MLAALKPLTSDLKRILFAVLPILAEIELACHHGAQSRMADKKMRIERSACVPVQDNV